MSHGTEEVLQRHRLTVANYHRMGETGIFDVDAQVGLMYGEIIDMALFVIGYLSLVIWKTIDQ